MRVKKTKFKRFKQKDYFYIFHFLCDNIKFKLFITRLRKNSGSI